MHYKNFLIHLIILILLNGCDLQNISKNEKKIINKNKFKSQGFTLIYNEKLYDKKLISHKMDDRDLIIFQKNLKKDTNVIIKNILNNKRIIARVGQNSLYPIFNNSVISIRIANEINLDLNEPYIEITEIVRNSSFIVKKAKTYDEEKKVANKAPVDSIIVKNINKKKNKNQNLVVKKNKFNYIIKIADFYFKDTSISMINRIKKETEIREPKIKKLSKNKYRVYIGPYKTLKKLQKAYNKVETLKFENIEIIKNEKNI